MAESGTVGECIDRYVEMLDEKRERDAAAAAQSKRLEAAAATLLDLFAEEGIQSIKRHGRTIFLTTKVRTKLEVDGELVAKHVLGHDLDFLATVNHQKLKSWIVEQAKEGEGGEYVTEGEGLAPTDPRQIAVPRELVGFVAASRIPAIGCRKA